MKSKFPYQIHFIIAFHNRNYMDLNWNIPTIRLGNGALDYSRSNISNNRIGWEKEIKE